MTIKVFKRNYSCPEIIVAQIFRDESTVRSPYECFPSACSSEKKTIGHACAWRDGATTYDSGVSSSNESNNSTSNNTNSNNSSTSNNTNSNDTSNHTYSDNTNKTGGRGARPTS